MDVMGQRHRPACGHRGGTSSPPPTSLLGAWRSWLTRAGLSVTGLGYAPARPALGRLAHIRAVLAVRLSLQDSAAYRQGRAWWRSERRIRAAIGGRVGTGHVPDAEVSWPDMPAARTPGSAGPSRPS